MARRLFKRVNRKKRSIDYAGDFSNFSRHQDIIGTLFLVRILSVFMLLVTGLVWWSGDDVKKQFVFLFSIFIINELIVIIGRYDIFGRND